MEVYMYIVTIIVSLSDEYLYTVVVLVVFLCHQLCCIKYCYSYTQLQCSTSCRNTQHTESYKIPILKRSIATKGKAWLLLPIKGQKKVTTVKLVIENHCMHGEKKRSWGRRPTLSTSTRYWSRCTPRLASPAIKAMSIMNLLGEQHLLEDWCGVLSPDP